MGILIQTVYGCTGLIVMGILIQTVYRCNWAGIDYIIPQCFLSGERESVLCST